MWLFGSMLESHTAPTKEECTAPTRPPSFARRPCRVGTWTWLTEVEEDSDDSEDSAELRLDVII